LQGKGKRLTKKALVRSRRYCSLKRIENVHQLTYTTYRYTADRRCDGDLAAGKNLKAFVIIMWCCNGRTAEFVAIKPPLAISKAKALTNSIVSSVSTGKDKSRRFELLPIF